MSKIVREIREAAGMSQEAIARAIGKSTGRVRQYEDGASIPAEVVEQLKSIAAQAGRGDLAIALAGEKPFTPRRVVYPEETPITTSSRGALPPSAITRVSPTDRLRYHAMLDEIFDSGDHDAITAVVPNIELFTKWVRARYPQAGVVPTPTKKPRQK